MDSIQGKLLQLTQISLGHRTRFDAVPDESEWWAILEEAEKQKLTSFLFTGVDRLENDQTAPFKPRARFTARAFQIAPKNAALDERAAELSSILAGMGRASCILKGQGTAQLYEFPERRQCGDIDIWVEGDTESTIALLRSRWPVGNVVYHHAEVGVFKGTEVEVHFHPTWMNEPSANRCLQQYFEARAGKGFSHFGEVKGFKVPDTEFNLVFSLVHIFRHIFFEGIGLRQLVDYCHILKHSTAEERAAAYAFLQSIHLEKFCAALMWIMRECLGLGADGNGSGILSGDDSHAPEAADRASGPADGMLLCPPDEKRGRAIMESVFEGGNFGRHDKRNAGKEGQGLLARIIRIARLRSRFALSYPREIFWSPYFKTRQYLWRRRHGYIRH